MEKLKWKLNYSNNFSTEYDFLETILQTKGVTVNEIPSFLHPSEKQRNNPFLLNNMEKAVSMVHKIIDENKKILIRVDSDVDGYSSAAALYLFLKELKPDLQIDYILNYEKQHGLTYSDMSKFTKDEYGLIIIPDGSMTVKDAKNISRNFSADILVLDHHLMVYEDDDIYTNYCTAVNCTDGSYPNPHLSGAGVVQKFIEAYIQKYSEVDGINKNLEYKYLDLISLGINADSMSLLPLENRYYVLEGMKEECHNNEFINELVLRKEDDMKWGRYITSMSWIIAPLINGVVRYGSEEEQLDTFKAMIGVQEIREYQPRRKVKTDPKPPLEYHSLQKTMARICENVKSRQDTEVRKFVKTLEEEIEDKKLDKNSILFVDGTKVLTKSTITGLVANKLTAKYLRPVVLMKSKNATEYGGSCRGYSKGNIENLKEFLENIGITVQGHSNAAGVTFPKNELDNIINKSNELMPLDQMYTIHTCDWCIPANELLKEYVQEVAENYEIWGSDVPEPTFVITNLRINASQIQAFGNNNNFIRFNYKGISFVKKYCTHDEYDKMTLRDRYTFGTNKKELNLNLICQFTLNSYEDKVMPEVKILYFDSEELNKNNSDKEFEDIENEITYNKINKDEDLDFDW